MKYIEYDFGNNVLAITSTREAGNQAFQVGDNKEEVAFKRASLFNNLQLDENKAIYVHQTHSDIIKEVTSKDCGKGTQSFESGIEADALYIKENNIPLCIFHADCVPIFFYDSSIPLVGIIHAGFIGTVKHITKKVLKEVIQKERINPNNMKIWIGPHRRKANYKVTSDEKLLIEQSGLSLDKGFFDMASANIEDVLSLGIERNNISDIHIDTTTSDVCYSAYKKAPIGRMVSLIMLK